MKYFKLLILAITLICLSKPTWAEDEVIAGEPAVAENTVTDKTFSLFIEDDNDSFTKYFIQRETNSDNFEFSNTKFDDFQVQTFGNFSSDLLAANDSGDDTTGTNDLSFDDENSSATNLNAGLFPSRISWNEKLFWGENGLMRKLGLASDLSPEQRTKELGWRRTFLTAHQTTGILTLALMLASCYTGQMYLDGKLNNFGWHEGFTSAAIWSYSATGLLAFLTPPPSIRRDEFSTITVHKTLAYLHMAGMVLTPILGGMIEDSSDWNKAAHFHQASAYVTTAIFATAMLVVLLFD